MPAAYPDPVLGVADPFAESKHRRVAQAQAAHEDPGVSPLLGGR